tara:strand:- start:48 stop:233 length:186 start_codon:yes stop_codon:yes gene_type:complete
MSFLLPLWYKGGEMDYFYINEKGKYERIDNRTELKKVIFCVLGVALVSGLIGCLYLMTNYL